MIRLNCFLRIKEGHREEVLAAAKRLTEESLKQAGCVAYDIFESATRPDVLMFCETWKDQEALDAHAASDVYLKEGSLLKTYAEMKLEKFTF